MSGDNKNHFLLFTILLSAVLLSIKFSIQGPLYPPEASSKGLNASQYGFTVSAYEFSYIATSAASVTLMNRFGTKACFIGGNILAGLATVAFGLLHYINDSTLFLATSFIIRFIEGIGSTGGYISITILITSCYKENKNFYLAIKEGFLSLGLCIGPLFGGVINDATDFFTPFLISGALMILAAICSICVVEKTEPQPKSKKKKGSALRVLSLPAMWIGLFATLLACFGHAFIVLLLEPYIRVFNFSGFEVGLLFLINSLVFAIASLVSGKLLDANVDPLVPMFFGTGAHMLCFIFLGPIPTDNPRLWSVILALSFNGLAMAGLMIPALINTLNVLKSNRFNDDETTTVVATGIWSCALAVGYIIGSPLGGVMYDFIGMNQACIIVGALNLLFFTIVVAVYIQKRLNSRIILEYTYEETDELLS